jgi:hypothetical protein
MQNELVGKRRVLFVIGGIVCEIGRWLAWPGQELGNLGVRTSNIGCQCEICQERLASKGE